MLRKSEFLFNSGFFFKFISKSSNDSLNNFFSKYPNLFKFPQEFAGIKTPWLAYPLVVKKNNMFNRKKLQIFFEKNNIQTRTIFTGNILKQPVMKKRIFKKHPKCDEEADNVMRNGILLGCHQGMTISELKFMCKTFDKFAKLKKL